MCWKRLYFCFLTRINQKGRPSRSLFRVNSTQKQGGPFLLCSASCFLVSLSRMTSPFFKTLSAANMPQIRRAITYATVQHQNFAQAWQRRPRILTLIVQRLEVRPRIINAFVAQELFQSAEVIFKSRQRAPHALPRLMPSIISETFRLTLESSTTFPVTITSAPADAAARACSLLFMPPPTISGRLM